MAKEDTNRSLKREDSGNEPKVWSKDTTSEKYHSRSAEFKAKHKSDNK